MRKLASILAAAAASLVFAAAMAAPPPKTTPTQGSGPIDQHDWMQRGRAADQDPAIRSALSAAPAGVGGGAAVVSMGPDGAMRTLRPGSNGFTCIPDNPSTPGPDPMCMDSNAMEWAMAWIGHRPPPDKVGLMYMLAGGTDASNTDPYAQRPDSGSDWVSTGPHLMVVGSASLLRNYPAGPGPDTRRPYVMWAGTPYAHLMIPAN
jgi:hypothetical protein